MNDSNDSTMRPTRRSVLKSTGGAFAGLTGVMAADPVAAHHPTVHERMGRLSAQNMCAELDNSLCDYVDTIADYADDPDNDPYYCPSDYPDDVCNFLSTIDQSWNHYLNTQHSSGEKGNADHNAADEAAAAKSRVDGNDYVEAAIKTGRTLHFIQDAGTLVHTGREYEQWQDYSIHYKYERWVKNTWSDYFKDQADNSSVPNFSSKGDVQYWTWVLADMSHDSLQDQWYDIKYPGSYDVYTKVAQGDGVEDAAIFSNGTIDWIWQNG